jgi:dTDP-4-amino-4,6-dideoxygalactose transaminase
MPVHLFGQCAEMDPLLELAAGRGFAVVEDAAQAIGARYDGRSAGTMGAVGCFSFFPSKNLGACGDAGLVTTADEALAGRLRRLREHGAETKYRHEAVGGNFRIDALQAALLRVKLARLDDATARRQSNAALYSQLLLEAGVASKGEEGAPISLPAVMRSRHIFNQFVIRVGGEGARDRLREHLTQRGIATEIYYPIALHLQACFAPLGGREGDMPVAEAAARETLAIPIFPELREEEIRYVAGEIIAFAR